MAEDRLRILAIDGGGIRGLIPALVLRDLERRLGDLTGKRCQLCDHFDLVAGTSTGGLIALGMTIPRPDGSACMDAASLVRLYREEGRRIFGFSFQRVRSLGGWIGPKHSPKALREVLAEELGTARLSEALREVVVTAYDMTDRQPHFFKRWRARESEERNPLAVEAALATAAAPTYFPSQEVEGRALIDGGVFANNPTVAAITEALKRDIDPAKVDPHELLVVSLGTGVREFGFRQKDVRGWGRIGWVWPRHGEAALLGAMLDGSSDAADHWAHMLLNHEPGAATPGPAEVGRGTRYFRWQADLPASFALDDTSERAMTALEEAAHALIENRGSEIQGVAERLAREPAVN